MLRDADLFGYVMKITQLVTEILKSFSYFKKHLVKRLPDTIPIK